MPETYSVEKQNEIKEALEKVIVHSNKVIKDWGSTGIIRNRRHLVSYDGIQSLVRGHIRKYLNALVDYRSLSSMHFNVVVAGHIKEISVVNLRAGNYNRYGHVETMLNSIFKGLDYKKLAQEDYYNCLFTNSIPAFKSETRPEGEVPMPSIDFKMMESFTF
jgi:hypothetical protein